MSKYRRTVAAAVAETRSKFALAEALANDIPPNRRGPKVGPEITVTEHLTLARVDIIRAGGEARSVETLGEYRKVAIWVSGVNTRNFAWVAGASFTAHLEALKAGMTYGQFVKLRDKTRDGVRRAMGLAPSGKTTDDLPIEEAAALAEKLMAEPEVANRVIADPKVRANVGRALDKHYDRARERDRHRDEPYKTPQSSSDFAVEFLTRLRAISAAIKNATDLAMSGPHLDSLGITDDLLAMVDWQSNALSVLRAVLAGRSDMDAELAKILEEG